MQSPTYFSLTHTPEAPKRMAVYVYGENAANKPIVFGVHGLGQRASDLHFLAETLRDRFTVYLIDVIGRGNSDWFDDPAQYHLGMYLQHAFEFLDHHAITEVYWVGISMGGLMGLVAQAARPSLVKALVLNDVGPVIPEVARLRILQYVGTGEVFPSAEAFAERYYRQLRVGSLTEAEKQHYLEGLLRPVEGGYTLHYDRHIIENFKKPEAGTGDLWEVWTNSTCPVLVLHGEQSDLLTAEILAEMGQHRSFDLISCPDCGHAPALVGALNSQIKDWLSNLHLNLHCASP
jgi:pimeloyl-ACP methyl ester carboxylesterase